MSPLGVVGLGGFDRSGRRFWILPGEVTAKSGVGGWLSELF